MQNPNSALKALWMPSLSAFFGGLSTAFPRVLVDFLQFFYCIFRKMLNKPKARCDDRHKFLVFESALKAFKTI